MFDFLILYLYKTLPYIIERFYDNKDSTLQNIIIVCHIVYYID